MDIIGFDAQINAPRAITKLIKKATAPRPVAKAPRPVATAPKTITKLIKKATAPRPVATAPRPVTMAPRPVATAPRPVTMAPRPVTMAPRPVATTPKKVFAMPKLMAPKPVATTNIQKRMTAKTTSNVMATSVKANKIPLAIIKKSGRSIPVKTLTNTTNANLVQQVSPVQRSYMPVDLPFQRVTPKSKMVRIANTPFVYPVNIDMIEPSVDNGSANYYGK
jgi:hypothetical protein